jgi:hypothetical protein
MMAPPRLWAELWRYGLAMPPAQSHKNDPQPQQNQGGVPKVPQVPVSATDIPQTFSDDVHTQETATAPCATCAGLARWNDNGILRCVVCWPQPTKARR